MNDKLRQEILKGLKSLLKEQGAAGSGGILYLKKLANKLPDKLSATAPVAAPAPATAESAAPAAPAPAPAAPAAPAPTKSAREKAKSQVRLAQQIENSVMKILGFDARKITKVGDIQEIINKLRAADNTFPTKQQTPDLTKRLVAILNYVKKNPNNVKTYLTAQTNIPAAGSEKPMTTAAASVGDVFSAIQQELKNKGVENPKAYASSVYDNYFVKTGVLKKLKDQDPATRSMVVANAVTQAVDAYLKDFPGSIKESWSTRNKNKHTNNLFERLTRNINK